MQFAWLTNWFSLTHSFPRFKTIITSIRCLVIPVFLVGFYKCDKYFEYSQSVCSYCLRVLIFIFFFESYQKLRMFGWWLGSMVRVLRLLRRWFKAKAAWLCLSRWFEARFKKCLFTQFFENHVIWSIPIFFSKTI